MGQNEDHIYRRAEDGARTLDAGQPLYEIASRIGGYKLLSVQGEDAATANSVEAGQSLHSLHANTQGTHVPWARTISV